MSEVDARVIPEDSGEVSPGGPPDQCHDVEAEEAKLAKAAEDARIEKSEEDARLKAAEEARLKAEEASRLKAAEEARLNAEVVEDKVRRQTSQDSTPTQDDESVRRRTSQDSTSTQDATDLFRAAEQRLRELLPQVKDMSVLRELSQLADCDALEKLVSRGKPPPKAGFSAGRSSLKSNPYMAEIARKADASKEAALDKSKHLGKISNAQLAVGGAGQGGGLGLNRPGFGPKVQNFAGGRSSISQRAIEINDDVSKAWREMQDDNAPVGWVITTYSDDGKKLVLKSKGAGGLNSFKSELPENVAWGGFRCYGVDRRGGLECKRPKFVFVQYKPEASSAIKKAKQASHKGDVKEIFPGAHVDVVVETMEDLEEQKLIEKLQAATGAHKPNGYEFDEGKFLEADYYGLGIGKSCKGETAVN